MPRRYRRSPNLWLVAAGVLLASGFGGPIVVPANTVVILITAVLSLIAVAILFVWAWNGYQRDKLRQGLLLLNADDVDAMHHRTFEKDYVPALLRRNGYHGIRTTPVTDHGIDVIAKRDGVTYGIQVKHTTQPYKRSYNNTPVQEAVAGIKYHKYRCDQPMVITNGYLTKRARELAKDNNCTLIDRDGLAQLALDANTAKSSGGR